MNKQTLLEKRYIIRLLGLILEGTKDGKGISNQEIAARLKKQPSSIFSQLSYLEREGLIFKERDKDSIHNRLAYFCDSEKLAELFLAFLTKERNIQGILKYKENEFIQDHLCLITYHQLIKEDSKEITLKQVFNKAYETFIAGFYQNGKEKMFFKGNIEDKKEHERTKKEFIEFTNMLKDYIKKEALEK